MGNLDNPAPGSTPEAPRTECLSANSTLMYRVFAPVAGTVFWGGWVLILLSVPADELYLPFPAWWLRVTAILTFFAWLYWAKNTIWRLKRVDADETHLFVTNYWHTVRYPWTDVAEISESKRMGKRLVHIHLKAPGRFGQVISFLPANHYDELIKNLRVREV